MTSGNNEAKLEMMSSEFIGTIEFILQYKKEASFGKCSSILLV